MDAQTGPDSLRWYLTGAVTDGGAQADPDLSLGAYRSSSEVAWLGWRYTFPLIQNLRVDHVSGQCGTGTGAIMAVGADEVYFTAPALPDGSQAAGPTVTIANGETKVLRDGTAGGAYVRVTRTSTADLLGSTALRLMPIFNNVWSNVASATAEAGGTDVRCLCLRNESATDDIDGITLWLGLTGTARSPDANGYGQSGATTVTAGTGDFDDWPPSGWFKNDPKGEIVYYESRTLSVLTVPAAGRGIWGTTVKPGAQSDILYPIPGIRIGTEAPDAQPNGTFTDRTGQTTAPPAVSLVTPISANDATALAVGGLSAGQIAAVWMELSIPAGQRAADWLPNPVRFAFSAA